MPAPIRSSSVQKQTQRRDLDGVLLLDKPAGITSNAALQRVKRLYGAAKAGHCGTLDPMATGLLPACFGEATKFSAGLLDAAKTYQATIKFGITTTTGDAEGEVLADCGAVDVQRSRIEAALVHFVGDIQQVPPMYSALKRDGKALYTYARQGIELERAPRFVHIFRIELIAAPGDEVARARPDEIDLRVRCSKGTYVRVLAEDIGRALGCGAHLKALRRVAVGGLHLDHALTFTQLEAMTSGERDSRLLDEDSLLSTLPSVTLDAADSRALLQGKRVCCALEASAGSLRIYDQDHRFLGIGEIAAEGLISPKRLISTERFA
ncbi:MAG: tRNA pseudouridine(55) synthase TruB [Burkholderiales bacterium]